MASWGIFSGRNYAGTDQGVDFRGSGLIPALGSATVTDVGSASIVEGGTYPYVVYRLDSGPYRGGYVYTAENFVPTVRAGQHLKEGESIGFAKGSYPFIETGFNKTAKGWNAVAPLGGATAAGQKMKAYIYGLIGSAPPVTLPAGNTSGILPSSGFIPGLLPGSTPSPQGIVSGVESVGKFLGELSSAAFWIRVLEIVGGGILIGMGLYLLTRQVGLAASAPALPPPAKGGADTLQQTFSEPPGIDAYKPAYRGSREGVKRKTVRHEVSEASERRRRTRELSRRATPAEDIPF